MNIVTTVLLTYNHEKTIAAAMDSILEQKTGFDFDIYVLEDCSTDGTAAICRQYKEKYPDRITLFLNEKNLGVTENLKQGLLKVKSKYYAFLEGDDIWCDPGKLQKQVDALEQNPDCVLCGHNTLCKDLVNGTQWLLVEDPVKTRYTIRDKFGVHLSSRLYRNIVDLAQAPSFMVLDTHSYLLYMTQGDLYYINETMSVYNITGTSFWTGKTRKARRLMALKLRYEANQFFNFAYDYKYYPRHSLLKVLKIVAGVRAGWFLFYHLERMRVYLKWLFGFLGKSAVHTGKKSDAAAGNNT